MANRSYLYATDHLPESQEWTNKKDLHGIAEWSYEIPIVFKILLTGHPNAVRSSIWDTSEKIAISGDYELGLDLLKNYLSKLPKDASSLVSEAIGFLSKDENKRRYLILEGGEIFDMSDDILHEQNLNLVAEIAALNKRINSIEIPQAIKLKKVSFLDTLLGRKKKEHQPDLLKPFYPLGLGEWSNVLYYQLDGK